MTAFAIILALLLVIGGGMAIFYMIALAKSFRQ
jgi:hypothetical protein